MQKKPQNFGDRFVVLFFGGGGNFNAFRKLPPNVEKQPRFDGSKKYAKKINFIETTNAAMRKIRGNHFREINPKTNSNQSLSPNTRWLLGGKSQ